MSLTNRQRDCLLFLQRYIDDSGGVSPSYDEAMKALRISSKSGVLRLVRALEERGFIHQLAHRARAITIIKRIPDPMRTTDPAREAYRRVLEGTAGAVIDGRHNDDPRRR